MSSSTIVSKLLTERLLETEHGRRTIGNLLATLAWASCKAVLVLVLLLFIGQKLMRRWLHIVVRRHSQELFMLNLLLITLASVWIIERAGLSLALGAFIAGMLILETEYKHQVEEDIKSFRDVLLGLFFITIGMLLNLRLVLEHWWLVLLLLIGPVFLKFVLIAALAKIFRSSTGVALAQIATRTMATKKHVIIAGFGRSGQSLAKLVEEEGIGYHALDLDPDRVSEARASGATEVVPEALEGSLMLASHALVMLGVPLRRVVYRVLASRDEPYAALRGFFHGVDDAPDAADHFRCACIRWRFRKT